MVKNILLLSSIMLISCSPAVYKSYSTNSDEATDCGLALVRIHPPDSVAEQIGEVLIDDIGTSVGCGEEKIINYLRNEACSRGAQIVLIKEIKRPDEESFCYRCTAVFYKYRQGAKPVKTTKYFTETKIKKREQKDRRKQVLRTMRIVHITSHIIHFLSHSSHHR